MHQLIQPLHITRRATTTLIALSIAGLPQISRAQGKVFILTLEGFEKSQFFKRYKTLSKSNWPLKTGGTNYSYGFADTDGTNEKISVELSSAPSFLTRLGISFYGSSLRSPATFGQSREKFLRDLLSSTHPDILDLTPLHAARKHGHEELVALFLRLGVKDPHRPSWWRWLPV